MDVVVKGRNVVVPEYFREHVAEKLQKVERYDNKIIEVNVELLHERNPRQSDSCQCVEITCVSRGPVVRAEACAPDFYAALDKAIDKLEGRLRRAADRRRVHHGRHAGEGRSAHRGDRSSRHRAAATAGRGGSRQRRSECGARSQHGQALAIDARSRFSYHQASRQVFQIRGCGLAHGHISPLGNSARTGEGRPRSDACRVCRRFASRRGAAQWGCCSKID